jgi:peptidoglycan/xylan/chitin deacetylase (PgdA/CDA1 family)
MMRKYFIRTPAWLRKIYPAYTWKINTDEKILYLSFDDGPHPIATPFVLDELKKAGAKASFFCIGKNVLNHPEIYRRILDEGHAVGNHTQNHLNGWKVPDADYLQDIAEAAKYIDTHLFRPPYGRITRFQSKYVAGAMGIKKAAIIMWDVLSGDFDETLNGKQCTENILLNSQNGSIIVFHDSEKAWPRMSVCLPGVLKYFSEKGFRFEKLSCK